MNKKYNILFLTDWFPNRLDNQLAVFVRKHALATAVNHNVYLLFVKKDDSISNKIELCSYQEGNYHELVVYYKKSIPLVSYIAATLKGIKYLLKEKTPDIIHVNIPGFSSFPVFLIRFRNIPIIVTEHASYHIKHAKISFPKKIKWQYKGNKSVGYS